VAEPIYPEPDEAAVLAVIGPMRELASRLMRREHAGHTLQTTALVNEAFVRLRRDRGAQWRPDAAFYRAAAEAMRRVLIDHARQRLAQKRGGQQSEAGRRAAGRVSLDIAELAASDDPARLLDVEQALLELADVDAASADVVRLRMWGGMTVDEVAEALGTSSRSVAREWSFARAWLHERLRDGFDPATA
jgi:RNA polymerase sigma factor (TIGR02999 family)